MNIIFGRRLAVAGFVALLAALIFNVSYFRENQEAYLFPAVVSGAMLVFTLVSFFREAFELCLDDFQPFPFARQVPVIVMMAAGVSVIEDIGMYTTAFLILLLVSYWYSPLEDRRRRLLQSLALAGGLSVTMYALFSLLLKVQVPRGWLI